MRAQGFVDTPEGRILLADSETAITVGGQMVYRCGYAIDRDGVSIGNYNDYEWHETSSSNSDRDARMNEAVAHARTTLADLNKNGYYDDARKHDFSPRLVN